MFGSKLLLDANILIALEDPRVVPPGVALLAQKCQLYSIAMYVDEACIEDIKRDPNLVRREATLSKLEKFPVLFDVAHRPLSEQVTRFGAISNQNDSCDVQMLDTLDLGIVDFLVTEDRGILRRATNAGLRGRVFTVLDALGWIQRTFEPKEFRLRYIVSRKVHQIDGNDAIFVGLRQDYAGFDEWLAKCRRAHRDCWIVEIAGQLAGVVIYKAETHTEAQTTHTGPRILKICTLKMKEDYQGEKFGEQLLKKILWYAQGNCFDLVYVTAFPKHELLITLLQTFGFEITQRRNNGEIVMERIMVSGEPPSLSEEGALRFDRQRYPAFVDGPAIAKYIVPIKHEFHIILFPEIAEAPELPLFPNQRFLVSGGKSRDRTPGNTIRKVYVCRSPTRTLRAADLVLFYLSKTNDLVRSQSVTTVGVVERCQFATSTQELVRLVGRRSVYAKEDLESFDASEKSPVLVIDFLLHGHFKPHVSLEALLRAGAFVARPPQSIKRIANSVYETLKTDAQVTFE
jgi:ribosomal protein S18 acetylase RimI-like enzyme